MFYSYMAMQIPTGVLSDTQGPRRLPAAGAFVAAVGTLMFSIAHSFTPACVGRCLIGASVAVAFVGMLKLAKKLYFLLIITTGLIYRGKIAAYNADYLLGVIKLLSLVTGLWLLVKNRLSCGFDKLPRARNCYREPVTPEP